MKTNNTYSISEVAKILGLTLKATRRMVAAGQIETIKVNNTYRIDKEYFDSNVESFKNKSTFVEDILLRENVENKKINETKRPCDVVNWIDISKYWDNPGQSKMTFVDLFCGAGGFPCQGFSLAGNRIVDDPRNSLYLEMLEIVKTLQPDFVICENVKGLRSMLGGEVEKKIISDYKEIGYEMNVTVLCAADYTTPQKRERVIFIGNRIGARNFHPKPLLTPSEYVTTGEAIADLMAHPEDEAFNHVPTKHRPDMEKRMLELPEGKSLYKGYSDAWKKCPWNEASCTIKENHGGVNIHPKLPRVLTAREMARLQSFPDDFIFEGKKNKQLVQIGNAVPPLLGKAIGLAIRFSNKDVE